MYDYEINFSKENIGTDGDLWGAAFLWLDDNRGVEYNLCYDQGICECAIYKMQMNMETDYMETDYSTFEHYEIDPADENWENNLVKAMENAALRFFGLMSRENYIKLTTDELIELADNGDSEAGYYLAVRNSSPFYYGVPKTCGKFKADMDYYGTVEIGNR